MALLLCRSTDAYLVNRHLSGNRSHSELVARAGKGSGSKAAAGVGGTKKVEYGADWYEQTRSASRQFRTVREEMEYRREANRAANNGRERKDLYSANWDGDKYKGNGVNVLTVIAAISVLTPLLGLIFAYNTFGVLWG